MLKSITWLERAGNGRYFVSDGGLVVRYKCQYQDRVLNMASERMSSPDYFV